MIGPPLNDDACLSQLTALVMQQLDMYAPIARRFATTAELAASIRAQPQRLDVGDPTDGPKLVCDVPQRVREPGAPYPNCFERSALYLGAAELIDPTPLRQLATIGDATGHWRHTFPVENGRPVVLDPDLGTAAAGAATSALRGARNALPALAAPPPPTREQQLLRWVCDVAAAPAFALGGEEALQHVHHARRVLEQLGMLDNERRAHDCTLTLDAVRSSRAPDAALARYDLGLVVALAEQGAAYTDQPEQAAMLVALARGMLANLGVFGGLRNADQILDPYSSSPASTRSTATGSLLLDPYSSPTGKPLPPMPSVLDPYPSAPARATTPAPPSSSVLDPYGASTSRLPAPPPPSSLGNLSPITPIGVPSLPSSPATPPDRYSPDDAENALWSAIALGQRLKAESAAKDAAARFAAAVNAPPATPKHHKRQVLDPSNDPELMAILEASLAANANKQPTTVARNCACGGACGACRSTSAAELATSSAIVALYRNCPCAGTCATCSAYASTLPRNFDWQTVGDVAHTIGGAVLDFFHVGALKEPIGSLEAKIGMIHPPKPSTSDGKGGTTDTVQAVLAKLSPDEQAKAKAVFASLSDDQRQQLVAYLGKMSPDDAAAFVRKHIGSAGASTPTPAASAPKATTA